MIIELEKNKKYAVRFYYVDCFGRRQRKYKSGFPSESKARLWEFQEKARLEGLTTQDADRMTFGQAADKWKKSKEKENRSLKTLQKYNLYLDKYILKYIKDVPFLKVNDNVCQAIIDKHLSSPSNCVEIKKVLNCIFNYARKHKWIRDNPVELIDLPVYTPNKPEPYNLDDIITLLNCLKDNNSKLYTPVLCVCFFAATREEVCAILESDIKQIKDEFKIILDKAIITVDGETYLTCQKTKNRKRSFVISEYLYKELHLFKEKNVILSAYLCCNFDGSNIQPNTLSNEFSTFIKKHDLKYTTFHKLRDAYANSCKRLKIDPDTTFRNMGHSSYKITAEHYASADEILIKESVTKLEDAILEKVSVF